MRPAAKNLFCFKLFLEMPPFPLVEMDDFDFNARRKINKMKEKKKIRIERMAQTHIRGVVKGEMVCIFLENIICSLGNCTSSVTISVISI